jgi:phenylalanyl-tRNA synthetase alpha chain
MSLNNGPAKISSLMGSSLHNTPHHPINLIKNHIYKFPLFGNFEHFDTFCPIISITDNFDALLIPSNHPCRNPSDTYYYDDENVLRTHASAHQNDLLKQGNTRFLVTGDVYRKDAVDKSHYPVFHQMEGLNLVDEDTNPEQDLKSCLSQLVEYLFPNCEYRFNDDYFPFTDQSFEVEVMFNGNWLEILGCGVIHKQILTNCGLEHKNGWAFGLGL